MQLLAATKLLIVLVLIQNANGDLCPDASLRMRKLLAADLRFPPRAHPAATPQPIRIYIVNNSWCDQLRTLTLQCSAVAIHSDTPIWQHEANQIAQGGAIEQWFFRRIHSYPFQTTDPNEADVIFVDAPIILASQLRTHGKTCMDLLLFGQDYPFKKMAKHQPDVFLQNQDKVVLVAPFWMPLWHNLLKDYRFMGFSNLGTGKQHEDHFISIPSTPNSNLVRYYLNSNCLEGHQKKFDLFFIGAGRTNGGGELRHMLSKIDWAKEFPGSVVKLRDEAFVSLRAEEAEQQAQEYSETIASARFCLIVAGDTPNSRRLFEAILVGCIPILFSDWREWLPLHWLDIWNNSTLLEISTQHKTPEAFLPRLRAIIDQTTQKQIAHMQTSLRRILPDLLWGLGPPEAEVPLFGYAFDHVVAEAVHRIREKSNKTLNQSLGNIKSKLKLSIPVSQGKVRGK